MKKSKKRLLSYVIAAVVVVTTSVAYKLVISEADATSSVTDKIVVRVYDKYPSVIVTHPTNNSVVVGPEHTITYDWQNASQTEFTLTYNGEIIDTWIDEYGSFDPGEYPTGSGAHNVTLEQYGEYVLSFVSTGQAGIFEDSISFRRLATNVEYIESDEDNDPVFEVSYDDAVRDLDIKIYDSTGNLINTSIKSRTPSGNNSATIVIDMPDDAMEGIYTIVVSGLDASGRLISDPASTTFHYTPPTPEIPDTGDFLGNLNITKTDFLITGLCIFFSVTIFGLFLINRKKES